MQGLVLIHGTYEAKKRVKRGKNLQKRVKNGENGVVFTKKSPILQKSSRVTIDN